MTDTVVAAVSSDDPVTRRERRRQSDSRGQVLGLSAGTRRGQPFGSRLRVEDGGKDEK